MAARKRPGTNSVADAITRTQALLAKQVCPVKLTPDEEVAFQAIVMNREAISWTPHDLRIAGQLARVMVHIEALHEKIVAEGYTVTNERGTDVENCALRSMVSLTATQLNLNKTLGLSASQRGMSNADQDKRNAADRIAKKALEAASGEELI